MLALIRHPVHPYCTGHPAGAVSLRLNIQEGSGATLAARRAGSVALVPHPPPFPAVMCAGLPLLAPYLLVHPDSDSWHSVGAVSLGQTIAQGRAGQEGSILLLLPQCANFLLAKSRCAVEEGSGGQGGWLCCPCAPLLPFFHTSPLLSSIAASFPSLHCSGHPAGAVSLG